MNSIGAAQAAGQGEGELNGLHERLVALANTESELRRELKAARAQIAQLAQNEAMARSLLRESHAVTRALQERARLETAAATAQLRESLKAESAERARSQAELARATDELRARRDEPNAELESLGELFADLMHGEALGRQRLERLQQQVADHERQRQELQQQLDQERDARRKAEAQLLPAAPPAIPEVSKGPVAATDPARDQLREHLDQLQTAVAELEKRHIAFSCQVAEERGRARAQAERAVAEAQWSRDRAKAATEAEREAKDALVELRQRLTQAEENLRLDAIERERSVGQLADQLAELRKKREEERERANAEIGRRVQAIEELQGTAVAARAVAEKAAADIEDEKTIAARLRDQVGKLESARDAAQAEARELSLRERRTAAELAELKARAEQIESQLERSETRGATLRADIARVQEELRRAGVEARAKQDELMHRIEEERAPLVDATAEVARLAADAARLRAAEEERGRMAEALASDLALARGKTETMEDALHRNGAALAAVQAQKSELEAQLTKALQERDEEARSRAEHAALLREERTQGAKRIAEIEGQAAQANAAQERMSALASARREALVAELSCRFADAEALLQAQLGQSPREAPVFLQLGRLHYAWAEGEPGSHDEIAERLFARAAELDPHDATAPLYLGHVRLRRGLSGEAREAYREAIRRDAQCAPAHEALAVSSARSMKRQARIALAAAIALLLSSAALFVHRLVQGAAAPAARTLSESRAGPEREEKRDSQHR